MNFTKLVDEMYRAKQMWIADGMHKDVIYYLDKTGFYSVLNELMIYENNKKLVKEFLELFLSTCVIERSIKYPYG